MQPGASIPTGTLKQVSRLTDKVGELERRIQSLERKMNDVLPDLRPSTQSRSEHSNFHANPPVVIPITESPDAAQAALARALDPREPQACAGDDPKPAFQPTFRGRRGPRKQKLEAGPVTGEKQAEKKTDDVAS